MIILFTNGPITTIFQLAIIAIAVTSASIYEKPPPPSLVSIVSTREYSQRMRTAPGYRMQLIHPVRTISINRNRYYDKKKKKKTPGVTVKIAKQQKNLTDVMEKKLTKRIKNRNRIAAGAIVHVPILGKRNGLPSIKFGIRNLNTNRASREIGEQPAQSFSSSIGHVHHDLPVKANKVIGELPIPSHVVGHQYPATTPTPLTTSNVPAKDAPQPASVKSLTSTESGYGSIDISAEAPVTSSLIAMPPAAKPTLQQLTADVEPSSTPHSTFISSTPAAVIDYESENKLLSENQSNNYNFAESIDAAANNNLNRQNKLPEVILDTAASYSPVENKSIMPAIAASIFSTDPSSTTATTTLENSSFDSENVAIKIPGDSYELFNDNDNIVVSTTTTTTTTTDSLTTNATMVVQVKVDETTNELLVDDLDADDGRGPIKIRNEGPEDEFRGEPKTLSVPLVDANTSLLKKPPIPIDSIIPRPPTQTIPSPAPPPPIAVAQPAQSSRFAYKLAKMIADSYQSTPNTGYNLTPTRSAYNVAPVNSYVRSSIQPPGYAPPPSLGYQQPHHGPPASSCSVASRPSHGCCGGRQVGNGGQQCTQINFNPCPMPVARPSCLPPPPPNCCPQPSPPPKCCPQPPPRPIPPPSPVQCCRPPSAPPVTGCSPSACARSPSSNYQQLPPTSYSIQQPPSSYQTAIRPPSIDSYQSAPHYPVQQQLNYQQRPPSIITYQQSPTLLQPPPLKPAPPPLSAYEQLLETYPRSYPSSNSYQQQPPTYPKPPPITYQQPPTYQLPPTYPTPPTTYQQPPTYPKPPPTYQLPPTTYPKPPTTYQQSPTYQQPPPTYPKPPPTYPKPPTIYQQPPPTYPKPPTTYQQTPTYPKQPTYQQQPPTYQLLITAANPYHH